MELHFDLVIWYKKKRNYILSWLFGIRKRNYILSWSFDHFDIRKRETTFWVDHLISEKEELHFDLVIWYKKKRNYILSWLCGIRKKELHFELIIWSFWYTKKRSYFLSWSFDIRKRNYIFSWYTKKRNYILSWSFDIKKRNYIFSWLFYVIKRELHYFGVDSLVQKALRISAVRRKLGIPVLLNPFCKHIQSVVYVSLSWGGYLKSVLKNKHYVLFLFSSTASTVFRSTRIRIR